MKNVIRVSVLVFIFSIVFFPIGYSQNNSGDQVTSTEKEVKPAPQCKYLKEGVEAFSVAGGQFRVRIYPFAVKETVSMEELNRISAGKFTVVSWSQDDFTYIVQPSGSETEAENIKDLVRQALIKNSKMKNENLAGN